MPPYPPLQLHLLSRPLEARCGPMRSYQAVELASLDIASGDWPPFHVSFEEVFERLEQLGRPLLELDGSFAWSGTDPLGTWALTGMLYDHGGAVQRCEIQGCCPLRHWQDVLRCLGWPQQTLVVQLLPDGFVVAVEELERLWEDRGELPAQATPPI